MKRSCLRPRLPAPTDPESALRRRGLLPTDPQIAERPKELAPRLSCPFLKALRFLGGAGFRTYAPQDRAWALITTTDDRSFRFDYGVIVAIGPYAKHADKTKKAAPGSFAHLRHLLDRPSRQPRYNAAGPVHHVVVP